MKGEPTLPADITAEEIETFLDRVAEEIVANQNGEALLPMYQWLERQRDARMERTATMRAVMDRVNRKKAA